MDTLASIVGNIAPSVVGEYWNYYKEADQHVKNLKRKWELLESRKDDVKTILDSELRQGKKPKQEVKLWLQNVETIKGDIDIGQELAKWMFLSRMRKGEYAFKKTKEVEELYQVGDFIDGLVLDPPPSDGERMSTPTLIGESPKRVKEAIWARMLNNDDRKIGLYGMGGTGKSTVMEHIHNHILKEKNKFDVVIWATVSKPLNVFQLQHNIAHKLDLDFAKVKDEREGAAKLMAYLEAKKRYVIILDDMWEAFALEKVGIPEPTSANGCKLLLTTRDLAVCRGMSCKEFQMQLLLKEEARKLFLDKIERDVFNIPKLKQTAEEVLERCAQLPLAIVMIAASFKPLIHDFEWRNALRELKTSVKGSNNMEEQVLQILKFSYDQLKEEKLKKFLLHCALHPEDSEIDKEELIEHLIDEEIIERDISRQEKFDSGYSILSKLENACLLEGGIYAYGGKEFVKMHDLIRDMVLQFASTDYKVEDRLGLKDFSNEGKWREDLVKASLMYKNISKIPSNVSPRWPNLSTLLLQGNSSLTNVPDSLFEHLHGLKVLDLSDTIIESLPNSIFSLDRLSTLRLRGCRHLKQVPSLAKLTALWKLDLEETGIIEVPNGLEMLVNLRYLSLNESGLKVMPVGILPKLSHLQCLRVYWHSNVTMVKEEEIASLKELETFAGNFDDVDKFSRYFRSLELENRQLASYQIQVGKPTDNEIISIVLSVRSYRPFGQWQEIHRLRGKIVIFKNCNLRRGDESLMLPKNVQFLEIEDCEDLRSLSDVPSSLKHKSELQRISLVYCKGIEYVLSFSSSCTLSLPETLELVGLRNLRVLFRKEKAASVPSVTFSRLKVIHILYCSQIKKLLPLGLMLHLCNLAEIRVKDCEKVEEIIGEASEEEKEEEGMDATKITLPKLRLLDLGFLPELKTICSNSKVIVCDSLKRIRIIRCQKLNKIPLSLPPPPSLKEIKASTEWWESLEWDSPDTKNVLQPFFSEYKPRVSWKTYLNVLKVIDIQDCSQIKLLPPGLLLHLRNLEQLKVNHCEKVEEIIGEASDEFEEEEEEEKENEGMDTTKITLPRLRVLCLTNISELKTICSSSKVIVCDSLERIDIFDCPKLKRLPLSLPLLNGQLSPPPSLQNIGAQWEWWESLEWDCPDTKNVLQPFFHWRSFF